LGVVGYNDELGLVVILAVEYWAVCNCVILRAKTIAEVIVLGKLDTCLPQHYASQLFFILLIADFHRLG
jgi:hypothetical protein